MTRTSFVGSNIRDARELHPGAVAASLAALLLRGYIAFVWVRFGVAKLQGGWLTTNPLKPLFTSIAAGQLPTTAPGYSSVAKLIIGTHADVLLSVAIPFTEIAIGLALLFNVRPRTAALVACALNANLLLAGVATMALDGRMIVLQLVLIALLTLWPGMSLHALGILR
ncbi:MAG: hypothetical protein ABIY52_14550 [Gemmatimonadaceae bacterium]